MLTLDAHELSSTDPACRLFAAVWARQGRGYSVHVERGYIALLNGECYHGATAEKAVAGVRHKAGCATAGNSLGLSIAEFVARYARFASYPITLQDARDSGSCEYGIRAWCNAVQLPYSVGTATVGEVLAAFERRPQVEVRRAVLHAVRRARKSRSQLAAAPQ